MTTVSLPSTLKLVECGPADADDALALTRKILAELAGEGKSGWYNLNVPDNVFRDYYEAGDCTLLAVEDADGRRVAYAAGHFREAKTRLFLDQLRELEGRDVNLADVGYAFFIEVAKDARGQGLQLFLFQELERRLVDRGARYLTGLVSPENTPSLTNFRRAGYAEYGRILLTSGFPRLLMIKKIK